jgi:hypothetical protein
MDTITLNDDSYANGRKVTEDEALSGIGTYLSSILLCAYEVNGKETWKYGTVVDYNIDVGLLTLEDKNGQFIIDYNDGDNIEVVNEAQYALAPYNAASTGDISIEKIFGELDRIKADMAGSQGVRGKRLADQLRGPQTRLGSDRIAVFEIDGLTQHIITVQHALDWIYYAKEGRKAPSTLTSLLIDPSLDEHGELIPVKAKLKLRRSQRGCAKSPRVSTLRPTTTASKNTPASGISDVTPAGTNNADIESIIRNLNNKHIAFSKNEWETDASSDEGTSEDLSMESMRKKLELQMECIEKLNKKLASEKCDNTESAKKFVDKSHFKPSNLQLRIHEKLVKEKYTGKDKGSLLAAAHSFCEDLLAEDYFVINPHPQIAVCLYYFGFGPGELSVMHGKKVTDKNLFEIYENQSVSMRDFSAKGKVPTPIKSDGKAYDDASIVKCLQTFRQVTRHIWEEKFSNVFLSLENVVEEFQNCMADDMIFPSREFVHWIDLRLYKIRSALASADESKITSVMNTISMDHRSFRMVELAAYPRSSANQKNTLIVNPKPPIRSAVPREISLLIPKDTGGKLACLKYWTKTGCGGPQKICESKSFSHFRPLRREVDVKLIEYVTHHYGELKNDAFRDQ